MKANRRRAPSDDPQFYRAEFTEQYPDRWSAEGLFGREQTAIARSQATGAAFHYVFLIATDYAVALLTVESTRSITSATHMVA